MKKYCPICHANLYIQNGYLSYRFCPNCNWNEKTSHLIPLTKEDLQNLRQN